MSSFAYWSDPVATFSGQTPTDLTPQMIDQRGKTHPAPWVPFTRAGCDVGAFSVANIEFENIGLDVTTMFGAGSSEENEAKSNPTKASADFLGIAVHCAQQSPLCATGRSDLLPDEPGGYTGFKALFGNKYVQPQISPGGPVKDIDGNIIQDASGNAGFPNLFNPSAAQTLGYLATMLEAACRWFTATLPTRTTITSPVRAVPLVPARPATSSSSPPTTRHSGNSSTA
jgi:hypothetical protein